jgi:BirA family biotin operon repressor/biotin-[acetyl-CoA-carboxylase] ligase
MLVRDESLWREVRVVAETGSTNADLLAEAVAGGPEGAVLVAEAQTAGRGRMGRRWLSPPGAGLTFSVLLRPEGVPGALLGWVPLLAGVAVVAGVRAAAAVDASLKWPNDVLVGGAKLGGILAERSGGAVVVGIGINVAQDRAGLPAGATSLLLEGVRDGPAAAAETAGTHGAGKAVPGLHGRLLAETLTALSRWYLAWRDQASPGNADACGLRREYARRCATLGQPVTVTLPGGATLAGTAAGVDSAGRLEVRTGGGIVPVSAGDVAHLR